MRGTVGLITALLVLAAAAAPGLVQRARTVIEHPARIGSGPHSAPPHDPVMQRPEDAGACIDTGERDGTGPGHVPAPD